MAARSRRARLVAAACLAAVSLTLALPLLVPAAGAQSAPLRISIYGDSVLLGARDQLVAQLAGHQVSVDAEESRSLLGAVGIFQAAGPGLGDVVVTDLGYNDGDDPTAFRSRIDAAMAALSGVKRVIWLNQREWRPGRAGMNAELAAAAPRHPGLEVLDWNAEVAAHPEDVYADGIHLTPAGEAAMATLVRGAVDRYATSLLPSTTAATPSSAATPSTAGAPAPHTAPAPDRARDGDSRWQRDREVVLAVAVGAAVLLVLTGWTVMRRRRLRRRRRRAQRRAVMTSSS